MRIGEVKRKTAETDIYLKIDLDGTGKTEIKSGVGFLDHMLTLFAKHGHFDLIVNCVGDVEVDDHHSVEDIGIALGQAVNEALSNKLGITRYGDKVLPMDEALVLCAIDISGRSQLNYSLNLKRRKVGNFDVELVEEFFVSFVRNCPCALHFVQFAGNNTHHIIEGAFKCFGRVLKQAVRIDEEFKDEIPSTKGVL